MTLYALASAGGAPGVTTTALALALSWPSRVIIAECDPAGGDILAGLLGGQLPGRTGLLPLAMEAGRSPDAVAAALWQQLIDLDRERGRLLLAGLTDPRQAAALESSWPAIAAALATVPADVLADCGRVDAAPAVAPVLAAASVTVLVIRPTLRHVARARQRTELLTGLLGGSGRLVVLLAGEGRYTAREVHSALGLPVAGTLPADRTTAAMLSDGSGGRRGLSRRPLVRAAAEAGQLLRAAAAPVSSGRPVAPPPDPLPGEMTPADHAWPAGPGARP